MVTFLPYFTVNENLFKLQSPRKCYFFALIKKMPMLYKKVSLFLELIAKKMLMSVHVAIFVIFISALVAFWFFYVLHASAD